MSKTNIYFYIIIFILVFILRFILFIISKKSKKKKKNDVAVEKLYLMRKFNLKKSDVDTRYMNLFLSVNDAFVITISMVLVFEITNKYILQILIGIVSVFGLIYLTNEIIGIHRGTYDRKKGKEYNFGTFLK